MRNRVLIPTALAFTAVASAFIYYGSDAIIDNATNVMTKPVAGIDADSSTTPTQTTKIDCSERIPRHGTNEVCAPKDTNIMLGKYEAPTRRP